MKWGYSMKNMVNTSKETLLESHFLRRRISVKIQGDKSQFQQLEATAAVTSFLVLTDLFFCNIKSEPPSQSHVLEAQMKWVNMTHFKNLNGVVCKLRVDDSRANHSRENSRLLRGLHFERFQHHFRCPTTRIDDLRFDDISSTRNGSSPLP